MKIQLAGLWIAFGLLTLLTLRVAAAPASSDATITSDELEIRDNGEHTFFTGHVILKQDPYVLHANQMIRTKSTGIVDAQGHLNGLWMSEKGEKVKATGEKGRYTPIPQVTELWEKAHLTRWQTDRDTEPVHISADHFTALHLEHQFLAHGHVEITQPPKVLARSVEAKYDQIEKTIHLYGPERVFVHVADAKGSGDFTGEEAWMTLDPKTSRMVGHVQGHIIPGDSL